MKSILRNFALASALVLSATSAFADDVTPTVTLKWVQEPSNITTSADARYGTGYNGKVYFQDKANNVIRVMDGTSVSTFSSYAAVSGAGISSDDAGNILVNKSFPVAASSTSYAIIEPDGTVHDLKITPPTGCSAARNDAIGRIVGDMMSDKGAIFYLMPQNSTSVWMIYIKNGVQSTLENVTTYSAATGITADATTVATPMYSIDELLAMTDPQNGAAVRVRGNKVASYYDKDNKAWKKFTEPTNANTQDGFDVFTLGGKTYQVTPVKRGGNNYESYFVIADISGNIIYESKSDIATDWNAGAGQSYGSYIARKVSDYKVEVYQYFATKGNKQGAAMWEVTIPEPEPEVQHSGIFVRGDKFGWETENCTDENELTYVETNDKGEQVYTIKLDELDGKFKIADNSWGSINFSSGKIARIGTQEVYFNISDNINAINLKNVTLTFYKGAESSWLDIQADPQDLYAVGQFQGWTVGSPVKFDYADGIHTLKITDAKANDGFKISLANCTTWDELNGGGLGIDDGAKTLDADTEYSLQCYKQGDLNLPADGDYTISVDLINYTLKITKDAGEDGGDDGGDDNKEEYVAPDIYLRGPISNWEAKDEYKMTLAAEKSANDEYVYSITLNNMKGCFKIGGADWSVVDYGAVGEDATYTYDDGTKTHSAVELDGTGSGHTYEAWSGSSIEFYIDVLGKSATLTFYYKPGGNPQYLQVEGETTGVEAIAADQNADTRYFNLNGVSVNRDQLTPGLYIKVANGRAQKVLVK
jgi:hypothetical protein